MNRHDRRALNVINAREARETSKGASDTLTVVPRERWPLFSAKWPLQIWQSKTFIVQLWEASSSAMPGMKRLSVLRTDRKNGQWADRITWDELMRIKRELGFGDFYAVEVYPRDRDIVNDANIRHLWLLSEPLPIGWS